MATNLTIPTTSVPATNPQQGSNILNAVRRGAIKIVPTHYYVLPLTFADFSTAAVTVERIVSTQWPRRMFPTNVHPLENPGPMIDIQEEFSDGATATITSAIISAGNNGDTDGLIEDTNVFTGAGTGVISAKNDTGTDLYDFVAALAMTVTLTVITANLDTLTQGRAILYIPCSAVPRALA